MPALEIIGAPQSNYVWVVRMVCEEKGVPYQHRAERPHTPDVDAIHPFGKIPVMRHGDVELCESKAIVTYIDRVFYGPKVIPDDPATGAKVTVISVSCPRVPASSSQPQVKTTRRGRSIVR